MHQHQHYLLAQLPVYVTEQCAAATRKLACGVAFMAPQLQTDTAVVAVLGGSLYMPQFPHRSVCEEYNSECAGFIAAVQAAKNKSLALVSWYFYRYF
jgi:hypothetical protein